MVDDQIKQLAENLKKNGLAASMYEALEKAKSIMNVKTQIPETKEEDKQKEAKNEPSMQNLELGMKNENISLNELMKDVGVTPKQVQTQEREKLDSAQRKIENIKEGIKEAEQNPEKVEEVKKEIQQVKEEVNQVEESKTQDLYKGEKKIDLTKVFGNNK